MSDYRPSKQILVLKRIVARINSFFDFSLEPTTIWSFHRVRAVLRGYHTMKNSANPDFVRYLNEQMSLTKIRLKNSAFSNYMLGHTHETIEIAYRQYILLNLTGTKLNANLLKHLSNHKPIVIPLPDEWLKTLTDNNIKVSKVLSKIFFLFFALKQYIIGVLQFFSYLIKNLLYQFKKKEISKESFSYLMYLHADCLPPHDGTSNYNIIEWYRNQGIPIDANSYKCD